MSRGGDWSLVGLASDPTPGSTHGVDSLARRFCQVEDTAREAGSILARVDTAHGVWEGHAAEAFSAQVSDLPANMSKCEMAYGMVADALAAWSSAMDSCQGQADRGLEDALGAQADIDAAQAALDQALAHQSWWQGNLASQEEVYWRYKNVDEPPSWVDIPSVQDISSARSQVAQASMGVTDAQSALSGATSRFEAARKMILAAKQDYEEAAQNFVARVEEAKEESVRRDHWWESVANSELWQTIVTIATVVGFVAAFIFAPIGLVIGTVAGAILTADMILRFLDGETSTRQFLAEVALTFIPAGRILKSTQNGLRNANRFVRGGSPKNPLGGGRISQKTGIKGSSRKPNGRSIDTGGSKGVDAQPPVRVAKGVYRRSDGTLEIRLRPKKNWTPEQIAEAKHKIEQINARNPKKIDDVNSLSRRGNARRLWESIHGKGSARGKDVDHILDLQLGGEHHIDNLQLLDRSVNRSFGSQIHHRLGHVEESDRLVFVFDG
ncbi:HNH endonuclease [Actinomycetaceae bacterium WB03_NA08]|uniref:HNH endonuclease n=1 Tax=Scrofimicrobium canadense TaxID=2652290 RepID=A0A6N7W7U4_9ACTO|nr:HNH endonuclease signature motif containing protein [Scrofimicrobium canadense]MSS84583.1 HNH endonuclease [Scrofimicrobium canadense]